MHKGEFRGALETFANLAALSGRRSRSDALRDMAAAYTADHAADPAKRRFMIAATNAEVDALNSYARAMRQQRGDLGRITRSRPRTAILPLRSATVSSSRATAEPSAEERGTRHVGLCDGQGRRGCRRQARADHNRLDSAKDETPREVSFTVGSNAKAGEFDRFKLGYAGTIYKAQGATLDQAYVCHSPGLRNATSYVGLTRHRTR